MVVDDSIFKHVSAESQEDFLAGVILGVCSWQGLLFLGRDNPNKAHTLQILLQILKDVSSRLIIFQYDTNSV